jgi:hypothetical protein
MIDGEGVTLWEVNYHEELRGLYSDMMDVAVYEWHTMPSDFGGECLAATCDGGFILVHPGPGADQILWRIDGEGRLIWATRLAQLTDLSNETSWWLLGDDAGLSDQYIKKGEQGRFILGGTFYLDPWHSQSSEPFIIKFKDPGLVGVECNGHTFECHEYFPELWDNINDKLPLAKNIIETAKRKGTDNTIIKLMEQELTNAENAQKICDLESAEMHLDWIIQAAPEPSIPLVAILLVPLCMAWRRTRRTRTPA